MNACRVARTLQRFRKHAAAPERPNSPRDSRGSADCTNFLKRDLSEERRERVLSTLRLVKSTGAAGYAISVLSSFRSRVNDCSRSEHITAGMPRCC